jgi:hypothetical protein
MRSVSDRLIAQSDDLEHRWSGLPHQLRKSNLSQMILEVADYVESLVDLRELDRKLRESVAIDFESLDAATSILNGVLNHAPPLPIQ